MKILSLPIAPVGRSCSTRRVQGCARHCASATSAQPRGSSQSRGIAFHSTQVIFSLVRRRPLRRALAGPLGPARGGGGGPRPPPPPGGGEKRGSGVRQLVDQR